MAEAGLDGLLLFQQELMYWLTGYDTFGFCFFQSLVVTADGRMALLTRSADLRQAQHTSTLTDIRVWKDAAGADPARDLLSLARDLGLAGKRLGVEIRSPSASSPRTGRSSTPPSPASPPCPTPRLW